MNPALKSFEHYPYPSRLPMRMGPYTVVELLGQGGMGAVYRGYREGANGRHFDVAIKVVRDNVLMAADDTLLSNLAREAEVARGLSHGNVLQVQDFGEHHGIPFVVTELLRGQSADELLRAGRLSPGQSVRLVFGLVRGLAYMHAQTPPLVHRDVKPSNVFVTDQGDVKVVDYGLSKAVSTSSHSSNAAYGTTPYMSPERHLGRVSPAADVFAVGAVIYELMTGRRLFDGTEVDPESGEPSEPSPVIVMHQVQHVEQHLLSREAQSAVEGVVEGLGAVMLKCLRKDPAARFKDCGELEGVLEALDRRVGASLKGVARAPTSMMPAAVGGDETQAPRRVTTEAPRPVDTEVPRLPDLGPFPPKLDSPSLRPKSHSRAPWLVSGTVLIGALVPLIVLTSGDTSSVTGPTFRDGFVLVQAGAFVMGSLSSEDGRFGEETQHEVTLTRPFYIQTTEVTQGQWTELMNTSPSHFNACGSNCPVERVNWFEVLSYLNALSKHEGLEECFTLTRCTGTLGGGCEAGANCQGDFTCGGVGFPKGLDCRGYRLPTEAEWEYAARAGTSTARYASELDSIAWWIGNSDLNTHPVRQKAPNAHGLYDMLGNVWEWTWDFYQTDLGGAPTRDPMGPQSGDLRVVRGAGWDGNTGTVRAARRYGFAPSRRNDFVGFRPVRTGP